MVIFELTDGRPLRLAPEHIVSVCPDRVDAGRCWVCSVNDTDGGWLVACSATEAVEAMQQARKGGE